ncbi:pentapeptide repeat-containing protein [Amycolatopsis halotolerans]|uniref:Pentapeptide repeat-containing protein n=1 Tax=Amycolatopsis halotolerans TaxID=330083 RepID=A0ABV7QSL1_9PSEU
MDERPALRPIPRWVIWAGLPAMVVLAGVAVWVLLAFAPDSAQLDAIRTGGTLGVGLGGAVALWLAVRKQRSTELDLLQKQESHRLAEQVAADTREHQLRTAADAREDALARRVTEQYGKAVDQLGSERAPVRLGGLYALERLGQDHADGPLRQMIADVLCAYLRMPPDGTMEETQVRRAAQKIISDHSRPDDEQQWPGLKIDLSDAHLDRVDFRGCQFDTILFTGAVFTGAAAFNKTVFTETTDFSKAHFDCRTTFESAIFTKDALFEYSKFAKVATFSGVEFAGDAAFDNTEFLYLVEFRESQFSSIASFAEIIFHHYAGFLSVRFAGLTSFAATRFNGNVVFTDSEFIQLPGFDDARVRVRVDRPHLARHNWPDGWALGDPEDGWAPLTRTD